MPIPPDTATAQYYNTYDFSVLTGGHVEGNFTVLNGTPVTLFVFNDADYNAWLGGQNLTGLYTLTAASGTISLDVSGFDTFHVVFQHGPGYNGTEQDVYIDLTSTGLDPPYVLGGIAALIIGAVLLVVGVRGRRATAAGVPYGGMPGPYGAPPYPPSGPGAPPSGDGVYRVPPPLPGTTTPPAGTPAPQWTPTAPSGAAEAPTGTVVLALENHSAVDETVAVYLDGVLASTTTVPAGGAQQANLTARLTSPFGSTVTVEAVTSAGRRARTSVFVGARGTAPVTLRVG